MAHINPPPTSTSTAYSIKASWVMRSGDNTSTKVVVVAIGNCTNERLEDLFRGYQPELTEFESHATRAMIVLT